MRLYVAFVFVIYSFMAFYPTTSHSMEVSFLGIGKSWWTTTTQHYDPNGVEGYVVAFDGNLETVSKEARFKRFGDKEQVQGTPSVTAFNFDKPFDGLIKVHADYRTGPQGIDSKELSEIGSYSVSFMCTKSEVHTKGDDLVILPSQDTPSFTVLSEDIRLSDVPDNGMQKIFTLSVEECHGLMIREISTSMISIRGGRLNSYVMFRSIREIEFIDSDIVEITQQALEGRL